MRNRLQIVVPLGIIFYTPAMAKPLRAAPSMAVTPASVQRLRCEEVDNPLGVEASRPRLSWVIASTARDWRQSGYRILVASSSANLAKNMGDLWDSGQVRSGQNTEVLYKGKALGSGVKCFWKVRVWDNSGIASPYSAPAIWQMGLLKKTDWHGQWIGYTPAEKKGPVDTTPTLKDATWVWYPEGNPLTNAPEETRYFRRTLTLPGGRKVKKASLRIAADNDATVMVNGKEVGRAHDSWKSVDVFDVGNQLTEGDNVVAVAVTNEGTAAGLAAQLDIAFENGAPLTVVSNAQWKASKTSPPGWQGLKFDEADWVPVKELIKVGGSPWGEIATPGKVTAPPAPFLRRNFEVKGKLKRATAFIVGLGYYEMRLNGRKVGDHVLDPGWTRYDRRSLYVAHDVTSYLKNGANALGVILGTGHFDDHVLSVWDFENAAWRARPKMLLEMRLEYEDGRRQTVVSDGSWKASTGPITFDSISTGEHYDARLEMKGWDTPTYKDATWKKAQVVEPVKGILAAQISPPVRVTEILTPVKVTQPTPGVYIFDLGQNIAGVPQLRLQGPAGAQVSMRCAEKLHTNGTLDAENIDTFVKRRVKAQEFQTDKYTLKGQGREVWQPRFTYHGFQYIEVKGFPGVPTLDNLRGLVVHTDFAKVGSFTCSNPILNQTQQNTLWSYRNNFHGIPTDCPHREKNGWTGDAQLATELGLYNFDSTANYEKWLDDIADQQAPDGSYTGIIPSSGWGQNIGPAWDSAYPLIAWYLYEYRGDKAILQKHYPNLKRYVDFVTTRAKGGIVSYGLGDWLPAKTETPADITSTAYYYVDANIISKAATLLGKPDDAKKYADLAASIKAAFNAKFYNSVTGSYGNGSITSLSCALYQGMVEPENKARVVDNLVQEIAKQKYNMDVGILGAKYVLNTLVDNGRADVAYRMLQQRSFPSYGYWVEQGATTLWEDWNGGESRNHVMFGDVSAWFYKYLAGITPASPGFKQIVVRPYVLDDLTFAKASYNSVQGPIRSSWKKQNGVLNLAVTIPANSTATIYVPNADHKTVVENSKFVAGQSQVRSVGRDGEFSVFAVGSGTYNFRVG
jgi:alpha-L-rhamnosidase